VRSIGTNFAGEKLDVTDDFRARASRRNHHLVWARVRQRDTGAEHECLDATPRPGSKWHDMDALRRCITARLFAFIPRENPRAAGFQSLDGGNA